MGVATGEGKPAMTVQEWLKMRKKIEEQTKEVREFELRKKLDRRYEDV